MSDIRGKIGLEIHVQLATKTKLFCGCSTNADKPNTATCPICLGMPGAKPVLNKKVIKLATKLASAFGSSVQNEMAFSRKTYFYPDMSKNYQITQYEKPLALGGFLKVGKKKIHIRRIHIEEDPASLKHPGGIGESNFVLADYNRSGIPLVEIVTEPDIETPYEARAFITSLLNVLGYLHVYDPHNFSLRADVNVSLKGGQPVEIKEITGSKEIEKAIAFEIVRQESLLKSGIKIEKQTRHYSTDTGSTELMRTKETEEEYGYIFDADLPVFKIDKKLVESIRKSLPELPYQRLQRLKIQYNLTETIAEQIVVDKDLADCFELVAKHISSKLVASWFTGYLRKTLSYNSLSFKETGLNAKHMLNFMGLVKEHAVTDRGGEMLLRKLVLEPQNPRQLASKLKILKISEAELRKIVLRILNENKKAAEDYKSGESKALQFLIGQTMRRTGGRADAKIVGKLIENMI